MKRPRRALPAADLERVQQSARDARVAAGKPAEPPEDAEYERLQAERRAVAARHRKK